MRARLAAEPVVLAPALPQVGRRRWLLPVAAAAGVAMVAGVLVVTAVGLPGSADGYLTYLNRSRVDALRGLLAPLARAIAAKRGRDGLERQLTDVRRKLEAPS